MSEKTKKKVSGCSVMFCPNRFVQDDVSYYYFPKIVEDKGLVIKETSIRRRKEWISRLNRADLNESNVKRLRLCGEHFVKGKPSTLLDETNPDWAPSLNLCSYDFEIKENSWPKLHSRPHNEPNSSSDEVENMAESGSDASKEADSVSSVQLSGVNEEDTKIYDDFTVDPVKKEITFEKTALEKKSSSDTCVVFLPKACTFQGASPVINGVTLDVAGHLEKSGLIKNAMYIMSEALDSPNNLRALGLNIPEDCEKVPSKPFEPKHCLAEFKEEDLTTPEMKELYKIAVNQYEKQSILIDRLRRQNLRTKNRIKLLSDKLKILKRGKISASEYSILTEEYGSELFNDFNNHDFEVSSDDSNEFQEEIQSERDLDLEIILHDGVM